MMKKKALCLLLCLCCAIGLSGCTGRKDSGTDEAPATLPPAAVSYKAPDGEFMPGRGENFNLYLPGKDGLMPVPVTLESMPLNETLRALVEELLRYEGSGSIRSLGDTAEGRIALTLYGENPVEFSSGVCTVNLGPSARQLKHQEFYTAALSLAATLCELDEIRWVNVLVADMSVGLDITGNQAMGSVSSHLDENLTVLWEQMEAKRAPLGQDVSRYALTSYMTLYFPLTDGRGIACENRNLTFSGQTPEQMTRGILDAMSDGSNFLFGVPQMPDILNDLLLYDPLTSEGENGGRQVTLIFRENTEQLLEGTGVDMACLLAAITYSLTTYIPGVPEVCVRIGDKPITQLNSERFGRTAVLGGLLRRSTLEPYLAGLTKVYFARDGLLTSCEKAVDRKLTDSPTEVLKALMEGPEKTDSDYGVRATLPPGLGEEDILGISSEGDTLIVNLNENFRAEIQSMGRDAEMLLCYSLVNTLCESTGMSRVCFFFEGEQVEYIAGEIYWAGEFLYNTGLCEQSFG